MRFLVNICMLIYACLYRSFLEKEPYFICVKFNNLIASNGPYFTTKSLSSPV